MHGYITAAIAFQLPCVFHVNKKLKKPSVQYECSVCDSSLHVNRHTITYYKINRPTSHNNLIIKSST